VLLHIPQIVSVSQPMLVNVLPEGPRRLPPAADSLAEEPDARVLVAACCSESAQASAKPMIALSGGGGRGVAQREAAAGYSKAPPNCHKARRATSNA
jgi:hypothetical protein